jgi:hypothetical protein
VAPGIDAYAGLEGRRSRCKALGLTGRLPAVVLTLEVQAVQDAMWQPVYPDGAV